MNARSAIALSAMLFLVGASGCTGRISIGNASAQATEERTLTEPHVAASGLDVRTGLGAINIVADPSLTEVRVVAKITASAETQEEAKARLEQITIKLNRRADKVLELTVDAPKTLKNVPAVSFEVWLPDATGIAAKTGNGSVKLKGLGGAADVSTGIGSVHIADHKGAIKATTGNGSVTVERADGDVTATTSIGSVTVKGASGKVTAQSGNGSIHYTATAAQPAAFDLKTSIGSIHVKLPAGAKGRIEARTSIGSITVNGKRKAESMSGTKSAKTIVLSNDGPESKATTGNGSITVTLE